MRPFPRVKAGGVLSAAELNRCFEEIEKATRLTAAAPLILSPDWHGQKISLAMRPGWFVRITGHQSGSGGSGSTSGTTSGSVPSYYYSGIEQISIIGQAPKDNTTGQRFYTRRFPLIEMSENPSVPENAVVWAQLSASNDHGEFLWEAGGSGSTSCPDHGGSGSGCSGSPSRCCIRVSDFFQRVGDDCQYRDGCICLTSEGLVFIPDA